MPKPGHRVEFSTSSACSETRLLLGLHIQEERTGIPQPRHEIPSPGMNPDDLLVEMVTSEFLLSSQVKLSPGVSSCKAELQQVLPDHHILHLS